MMDKYLLTLLVTFEQEYAIQKLYGRHGWEYAKIDISTEKAGTEHEGQNIIAGTEFHQKNKKQNDDFCSTAKLAEKQVHIAKKCSVRQAMKGHVEHCDKSLETAEHMEGIEEAFGNSGNVSVGSNDDLKDYGGDTDKEGPGLTVKEEVLSDDNEKEVDPCVKTDPGDSDNPRSLLETLPNIRLYSDIVKSQLHGSDMLLPGPQDIDHYGFSADLLVYYCKDCGYTFPEEKYYTLHKRGGKCMFLCHFCKKKYTFRNYSAFQKHLLTHRMANDVDDSVDGELGQSVMSKLNDGAIEAPALKDYLVKKKDTSHLCTICQKTFSNKYNLQRHVSVHNGAAHCTKCSGVFDNEVLLKDHIAEKHDKRCFICEDCGTYFITNQSLRRHRIVKHNEDHQEKKVCPYDSCGRVFAENRKLEHHINTHLAVKPFKCKRDSCSKSYASRFARNKHTKTCGVDRPQSCICNLCGKSFSNNQNVFIHRQAVHDKKLFICVCGKVFKYIVGLYRHKKTKNH